MSHLKDLAEDIICAMADEPEAVHISEVRGERTSILNIRVLKSDLGHIIGQKGRNIEAIRTVLRACGSRDGYRVIVELIDPERQ